MRDSISTFLILFGAFLISVQLHFRILVSLTPDIEGQAQPLLAFVILILASLVAAILARFYPVSSENGEQLAPPALVFSPTMTQKRFAHGLSGLARTLVAVLLAFVANALLVPEVTLLQLAYFVAAALVISLLTARPYRIGARLEDDLRRLWDNRLLIGIWTDYNVRSRYSQTLLGVLWIVLLPVSTALVFSLVFGVFLNVSTVGDAPYLSFFLTGLTFWTAFNQGITGGVNSIIGKMGLINQVYFPREILVIVRLLEALVDTFFTFATLVILNLLLGILPGLDYALLLPIFAIQVVFTAGFMLFVSALTVFVRDVPQLVGVVMQILFYLTPILYPASSIPENFRFLTLINPLVPLIDAYRGIILDHQLPDGLSLYYPLVAGATLLYLGYRSFKRGEMTMQDYV